MKKFATFVAEGSTPPSLDRVREVIALTSKKYTDKRRERAQAALATLQKGIQDQVIYNAEFVDAKGALSSALETIYDDARDDEFYSRLHSFGDDDVAARQQFLRDYDSDGLGTMQSSKKNHV